MRRAASLVAALVVVAAAGSPAAAADDPRFGAMLVNVPLVVEHWDKPAVGVRNIGDVPITATVTIDGPGWGPAETTIADIEPGTRTDVPLSSIGTDPANVRAVVTNATPGMDRAQIVLASVVRHETFWEVYGAQIAAGGVLLLLVALVASWAVLRRLRRHAAD
jgi:hypothetical protein